MQKSLILLVFLGSLTACADQYRYPCQNPEKAKTSECSCTEQQRTKNKALDAIQAMETTTTLPRLKDYDC